jgi:hypothetical protein
MHNDNGRTAAAAEIRKAMRSPRSLAPYGPTFDARGATIRKAHVPNGAPTVDASTRLIKSIHSRGPVPSLPDTDDSEVGAMLLTKAERAAIRRAKKPRKTQLSQRGVQEIRDAHKKGGIPLSGDFLSKVQPAVAPQDSVPLQKRIGSSAWWNAATWQERRDAVKKGLIVPPQSLNASNQTEIADVGSVNDFDDEDTESPTTEHVGGFSDHDVSRSPAISAAVASVPRDAAVDAIKQALLPANERRMMP